jgi:uncharacterized protein
MASDLHVKLCDAAKHSEVAEIERLVAAGADPNLLVRQWTPLLWAATHGHAAPIAALVAAGARVNGANSMGSTALMSAAANDRAVAIDALLAAGADAHVADKFGFTALHRASIYGHLDTARALLEAGARTGMRNKEGKRPIDVVCALARCPRLRLTPLPPPLLRNVQVSTVGKSATSAAALTALLAAAAPWSRRRPVAVSCYAVDWEWEA